jgi:hypothetical protein
VVLSSHLTGVYDPKTFIPHAASLRQAFAHCAIFLTAASRRSLDRISVPVWPFTLSGRLAIIALVGLYPTNKLIARESILERQHKSHLSPRRDVCSINLDFSRVSFTLGQVLTYYSPVRRFTRPRRDFLARLACVKHAASVHSEPESNSPSQIFYSNIHN